MKPSERLGRWEDMSPMEFVAVRREVAQLEAELGDFRDRRDEKFQMYEECIAENIALKQGIQHLIAKTRKNVKMERER